MSKRIFTLLLALAMLAGTVSCGGETPADTQPSDTGTDSASDTVGQEPEYTFTKEYSGETLTILNAEDIWSMHARIDRDGTDGEVLNDAMYERCRKVEEEMEITLEEINVTMNGYTLGTTAHNAFLAAEDIYDLIFVPGYQIPTFKSEEMLLDLASLDGLQLDKDWWIRSFNDAGTVNGELYTAASYIQLMVSDSSWCLFFNESMMEKLGLDKPYDLVREGKWTFDRLAEYAKAGAMLNGDDSFDWDPNGKSVYGVSGAAIVTFMHCAGEQVIENQNGELVLTAGSQRFYDVFDKFAALFPLKQGIIKPTESGAEDGQPGSYITLFETERALFLTGEICKTTRLRDKSFSFGIVPYPKYDENQEQYYSMPYNGCCNMAMMTINGNPEFAAAAADALAYVSLEMVAPVYREVTLEQKGLRNDDSIEMLEIIMSSSVPELTAIYGIGGAIKTGVDSKYQAGETGIASVVAANKESVEAKLEEING